MPDIPKSNWIISPVYFKVKLVDNFADKYLQWYIAENWSGNEIAFLKQDNGKDLEQVLHSWLRKEHLWLYQYPAFYGYQSDYECDYFEKEDDNYVIPRHLFDVV